ncbi:Mor transcription activator family protein [Mannheimia haemolytica]|uniref:Mor transcription activator family protein n=1 Tax=Mannheimia haemolytica TaxID=75985 RepID=UPI000386B527|nr:Mor transcription activator family protein [Mannheimia haemolytica]EPZ00553.1 transcriptional regulator [Mannheimia haemolytica D35]MDW1149433.1 Mor transcription activator family protein [Mannheimia haemolytica]MDW1159529.1 Mor transcription activator family protein [Mannheimia haemolytica]NBB67628.1 transcriptional regulator [Mannheimia haemolytica]TRC48442.1 transcriptional regulator [Mannheimia haemolytica]
MQEIQAKLFDDDHAMVGQLFDHLDNIPSNELENRWPSLLIEVIDVMQAELLRQQVEEKNAKLTACKLAGVLAHYFGGKSFYLPAGDKIKEALRDVQIYRDFDGKNVPDLVKKYRLSESTIYAILRQQRSLQRRRHQMDLFNS